MAKKDRNIKIKEFTGKVVTTTARTKHQSNMIFTIELGRAVVEASYARGIAKIPFCKYLNHSVENGAKMPSFSKVLQPQYYSRFQCIAARCAETCCSGWGNIVIEESTYNFYKKCPDLDLQKKCQYYVVKNSEIDESEQYKPYAFIRLQEGQCPFLTEEKLCHIQKQLGEAALSISCDTYPRNFNKVNNILQRSLDISCLEAAKLILLNEKGIEFEEIQAAIKVRNHLLPEIAEGKPNGSKVYKNFTSIQNIVIQILQNRRYSVDERLMILSIFCEKLEASADGAVDDKEFADFLQDYKAEPENEASEPYMKESRSDIKMQFEAMNILLEYSLKGTCTDNFRRCMDKFKMFLKEGGAPYIENYKRAYDDYYHPKIENYMYILENYLVNNVYKDLFPAGPQINAFFAEHSIRRIHMVLIIKYVLLRTILIGIAGYYKREFHIGHIIKTMQAFEKTIGHNLNYLTQAVNFMDEAKIQKQQGCLLLLKL